MQLGINFVHDTRQAIGFDADAVRALRPGVVRFVVNDPSEIDAWLWSAHALRLRVLWCLPVERIGVEAARHAARAITFGTRTFGAPRFAGLEIGDVAWSRDITPEAWIEMALDVAILASRSGIWERGGRGACPILIGSGYDGSVPAWGWTLGILELAQQRPLVRKCFSGLAVSGTLLGSPLQRRPFQRLNERVASELDWRIAFTRLGWPIGSPLGRWQQVVENWREVHGNYAQPNWTREVSRDVRDRWLLEAVSAAERPIGASHAFLDPEPTLTGMNRWALYDSIAGRTDPLWHGLTWNKQAALRKSENRGGTNPPPISGRPTFTPPGQGA